MKKFSVALGISLILLLVVVSTGSSALPGTGWWSALWVQNTSGEPGKVSMVAYDSYSNTTFDSEVFDFNPNKALVYHPGRTPNYPAGHIIGFQNNGLPSGFEGSVVLSSSVPAASISQIANFPSGNVGHPSGRVTGMFQGVGSENLATELYAPSVKYRYVNSTTSLFIQAAGNDANVTVTFTMANGDVFVSSQNILANRSFMFDLTGFVDENAICGFDTNTSPCFGSAIVTSDEPIAGTLIEQPHAGTPLNYLHAMRMLTPIDESVKLYVPTVKNYFCGSPGCEDSGATVLNVGDQPANVTVTLTVTKLGTNANTNLVQPGDVFVEQAIVQPGTNLNFSRWNNNLGELPAGTLAATVIESDQPLVSLSTDLMYQVGPPTNNAESKYIGFADELATSYVFAPRVTEFFGPFTGGVNVQNTGPDADHIIIEYHEHGTDWVCIMETLNPVPVGAAAETNWVSVVGQNQFGLSGDCTSFTQLAGREFSVRAYTQNGQNVVMIVVENNPSGRYDVSRYEGINID